MGICRRSRYLGVVKNGVADLGVQAKWRSQVRYVWTVKIFNYEEEFETSLRCGDADARGVPFPEGWRTALKCLGHGLGQKAGQAAEGVRRAMGRDHVECLLLGLPKPVSLPLEGATRVAGCVAQLETRDFWCTCDCRVARPMDKAMSGDDGKGNMTSCNNPIGKAAGKAVNCWRCGADHRH